MKNESFSVTPEEGKQEDNQSWWEDNPMTYDWEGERSVEEGSKEWFNQLDEEFWQVSKAFAHPDYPNCTPYSSLVDYSELKGKKMLEIGCGSGAQAAVFANAGAEITAIDLTERAIEMTKRRFDLFDIKNATIMQSDAENLPFDDNNFDFVWSWGVIHHSANTEKIAQEIYRVLKPGGKASIMIYNRNSVRYIVYGLYQGIFKAKFLKHHSLYAVNMTYTDGHIARHYTRRSAAELFKDFSSVKTSVMDEGIPSIPGLSVISRLFPKMMNPVNHWINMRWGWFLFINIVK